MARRVQEDDLQTIEAAVRRQPEGMTARQINDALESPPPYRTLQYRLKSLVESKRLVMEGAGRSVRYRPPKLISLVAEPMVKEVSISDARLDVLLPMSEPGTDIREQVRRRLGARDPVGYNRDLLDRYRPNETFYLSAAERERFREVAERELLGLHEGNFARYRVRPSEFAAWREAWTG